MDHLIGDASKARRELGWTPAVDFHGLVEMMVDADVKRWTERRASGVAVGDPSA